MNSVGAHRGTCRLRMVVNLRGIFCRSKSRKLRQDDGLGIFDKLVRDQEVGGSNPLAPTTFNRISDLQHRKRSKSAWDNTRRSMVHNPFPRPFILFRFNNFMLLSFTTGLCFWLRKLRMIPGSSIEPRLNAKAPSDGNSSKKQCYAVVPYLVGFEVGRSF